MARIQIRKKDGSATPYFWSDADKTVREIYYPGSTYKPVTVLAGLEGGVIDPQ